MAGTRAPVKRAVLIPSGELGWAVIRAELSARLGASAVIEARDERDALARASQLQPTLVFTSEPIGSVSARPLVHSLRALLPPTTSIVVLANHLSPADAAAFILADATCCLLWQDLTTPLVPPLLTLLTESSLAVHSRSLSDHMLRHLPPSPAPSAPRVPLSPRELMVLRGLARGLTHQQIADQEFLSTRSVRRTIAQLQRKLAAPNTFLLGLRAGQLGLASDLGLPDS